MTAAKPAAFAVLTDADRQSLIWLQARWDAHHAIALTGGVRQAARASSATVVLAAGTARELRDRA